MNIKTMFTGKACTLTAILAVGFFSHQEVENNPDLVDKVFGCFSPSSIDVPSPINKPLIGTSHKYFELVAGNFNRATAAGLNIADTAENKAKFEQCQINNAQDLEISLYYSARIPVAVDKMLSCLQPQLLAGK